MLKVVLSGGPCGGKSTAIKTICEEFSKIGYNVLVIPETATELISNGIAPGFDINMDEFQSFVLDKQLFKEELYLKSLKYFNEDKTIILYDRCILDQMAYIKDSKMKQLLKERGLSIANVNERYDIIIHLVTAAKGTDCYTTENNTARRETLKEAILVEDKTLKANLNHPHIKVVDNSTDFETKIQKVINIIKHSLNTSAPLEIERKFLVKQPEIGFLNNLEYCSKAEIVQTYLTSITKKTSRRIRQRGNKEDGYSFYYTEKSPYEGIKRIENEKIISFSEYVNYLNEADTNLHQIKKTRYCFIYENQFFELDIYPFNDDYAILEIELLCEDEEIKLPDFLTLIKEVTDDKRYKNHAIAKDLTFPDLK